VDLNKNCSEYTQRKVDSDNVETRHILRQHNSHGDMKENISGCFF